MKQFRIEFGPLVRDKRAAFIIGEPEDILAIEAGITLVDELHNSIAVLAVGIATPSLPTQRPILVSPKTDIKTKQVFMEDQSHP